LQRFKQSPELVNSATNQIDVRASLEGINLQLLAGGWAAAVLCWTLLGVSLWATLTAIGAENVRLVEDLPRLIAAVTFSVVAGFLSMLPGGLVVRDALLMQLLVPVCGKANSLVAAVLLRLVWLVTEVAVCGILYVAARIRERGARSRSF
jgi:hypothetical protein